MFIYEHLRQHISTSIQVIYVLASKYNKKLTVSLKHKKGGMKKSNNKYFELFCYNGNAQISRLFSLLICLQQISAMLTTHASPSQTFSKGHNLTNCDKNSVCGNYSDVQNLPYKNMSDESNDYRPLNQTTANETNGMANFLQYQLTNEAEDPCLGNAHGNNSHNNISGFVSNKAIEQLLASLSTEELSKLIEDYYLTQPQNQTSPGKPFETLPQKVCKEASKSR